MQVSVDELTIIQSEGAHSRELNFRTRNLFYASKNMPAATGCAIDAWQARTEAWEAGWEMEDGIGTPEELAAIMFHLGA
jgi:hypothetical protein